MKRELVRGYVERMSCVTALTDGGKSAKLHVFDVRNWQGLPLVHFSAQRKRFMWDRGCLEVV